MIKCVATKESFYEDMVSFLDKILEESGELYPTLNLDPNSSANVREFFNYIKDRYSFTSSEVEEYISGLRENIEIENVKAIEKIFNEVVRNEKPSKQDESTSDYLIKSFKTSLAKIEFYLNIKEKLFNSIILDLDNRTYIDNNSLLNDKIYSLKNELWKTIKSGLNLNEMSDVLYDNGVYVGNYYTTADTLRYTYFNNAENEIDNWFNDKKRYKDKLEAYYAFVALSNFDTIISQIYGKKVNIKTFNNLVFTDNYSLGGTTNMNNTFRDNDKEIIAENEIDVSVKEIITNLPLIINGIDTGQKLSLNDYLNVITLVKSFLDLPIKNSEIIKDLRKTVANIRINPNKYIREAMDKIKNNFNILKEYDGEIGRKFKLLENSFNSIYQGFFGKKGVIGINSVLDNILFQAFDSMGENKLLFIKQDNNSNPSVYSLNLNIENSLIFNFRNSVLSNNTIFTDTVEKRISSLGIFTEDSKNKNLKLINKSGDIISITYDITSNENKELVTNIKSKDITEKDIIYLLGKIFHKSDFSEIYDIYKNILKGSELDKLLKLGLSVLHNPQSIYHSSFYPLLRNLAIAESIKNNDYLKGQTKDSSGNAISNYTLSRLSTNFWNQIEYSLNKNNSPIHSFKTSQGNSLYDPDIIKGFYQLKEIVGLGNLNKKTHKQTKKEAIHTNFITCFLQPRLGLKTDNISVTNGNNVLFQTNVNSDKANVPYVLINLNNFDFNNFDDFKDFVRKQMYDFHKNLIINIIEDYQKIDPTLKTISQINEFLKNIDFKDLMNVASEMNVNLTDNIHYTYNKNTKSYEFNSHLVDNAKRFSDDVTFLNFIDKKSSELAFDVLNSNFKLNFNGELKKLYLDKYKNTKWTVSRNASNNSNFPIAYLGQEPIYTKYDLKRLNYKLENDNLELNPEMKMWNLMDFYFSQAFNYATVGVHYAHSSKDGTESSRHISATKRNVKNTAQGHAVSLNTLNGVPDTVKVAVVKDDSSLVQNIYFDEDFVKNRDGATYETLSSTILMNNSLGGEKVGYESIKPLIHSYDPHTASTIFIKTASFPINNKQIRNEIMASNINKKSLDLPIPEQELLDITKDFKGNNIYYDIYYKTNSILYEVLNISYKGNGIYEINIVGNNENITKQVYGRTNYEIWKNIFGGEYSSDKYGNYNDSSHYNLVKMMNNVGILKENFNNNLTQEEVYQPYKHYRIDKVLTEGAIKDGLANINEINSYFNNEPFNTMEMSLLQYIIQLDKEHHADNSTLSNPTQITSILSSGGKNLTEATEVYEAFSKMAGVDMDKLLNVVRDNLDKQQARRYIIDLLAESLLNGDGTTTLEKSLSKIINAKRNGVKLTNDDYDSINVALGSSDNYSKVVQSVASHLNNTSILFKLSGILSVLHPSNDMYTLYGDEFRRKEYVDETYINEQSSKIDPYIFQAEDGAIILNKEVIIEIGKTYDVTYSDGTSEKVRIDSLEDYDNYKLSTHPNKGQIIFMKEDVMSGRNLKHYNIKFTSSDGSLYQIWDIATKDRKELRKIYDNIEVGSNIDVINRLGELETITISKFNIEPCEIIIPRIWKTAFNISDNDNFSDIVSKKERFFLEKMINNSEILLSEDKYDICLRRYGKNNFYIKQYTGGNINSSGLIKKDIKTMYIKDKLYRIDDNNKPLYKMNEGDIIYQTIDGSEIVYTSDVNTYIERKFDDVIFNVDYFNKNVGLDDNSNLAKLLDDTLDDMLEITDSSLSSYDKTVDYFTKLRNKNSNNKMLKAAKKMYHNFNKALEVVAGRIPAQTMQSFMGMKVVGFSEGDINTTFVSNAQIYLQGSDYDIDTVSIMTYSFDENGNFYKWSPYSNIRTMDLKLPSGIKKKSVEIVSGIDNPYLDVDFSKIFTFTKDKIRLSKKPDYNEIVRALNKLDNKNDVIKITDQSIKKFIINNPKVKDVDLINAIATFVNDHAEYESEIQGYNNFIISRMRKIILNPANQDQAQISIDESVKPFKAIGQSKTELVELSKRQEPGNAISKINGVFENAEGSSGIAIVATGLKGSNTITQVTNMLLKKAKTKDDLIDVMHHDVVIQGKPYVIKANANTKLSNVEDLPDLSDQESSDLIQGALMSLSVDNAKELMLAKLNANTNMLGMYVYGISIGMNVKDITNLLMSEVGDLMKEKLDSDIYEGVSGKSALSYLNGLKIIIDKITNPKNKDRRKNLITFADGKYEINYNYIFFKKDNIDRSLELAHEITVALNNKDIISDLIKLAEGAEEYRILGSVLKINQGLTTSISEIINYKQTFNDYINKKMGTKNIDYLINFIKSNFDKKYEDDYRMNKVSVNLFTILKEHPLFRKLLEGYFVQHELIKNGTYKFSTVEKYSSKFFEEFGIYKNDQKEKLSKKLSNLIDNNIRMLPEVLGNKTITIPSTGFYFTEQGKLEHNNLNKPIELKLNNMFNESTLKYFVESKFIPELKKQFIDNKFVTDLTLLSRNNTLSKSDVIAYSLPISMLPSNDLTDSNSIKFSMYKNELSKLIGNNISIDGVTYNIGSLLYLYSQIAYASKISSQSLVSLFRGFEDRINMMSVYNSNLSKLEKSNNVEEKVNSLLENDNIIKYNVLPRGGNYIFHKNNKGITEIKKRIDSTDEFGEPISEIVTVSGINKQIEPYHFEQHVPNKKIYNKDSVIIELKEDDIIYGIQVKRDDNKIVYISSSNKNNSFEIVTDNENNVISVKKNGEYLNIGKDNKFPIYNGNGEINSIISNLILTDLLNKCD